MRWVRPVVKVIVIMVLLGSALWACLPVVVERSVLPVLLSDIGVDGQVEVQRIGVFGMELGPISLAGGVSVASVQVEYTPWDLPAGRVAGIRCSGLVVPLSFSKGGVTVPGLPVPDRDAQGTAKGDGVLPVFPVDRLELTGGTVLFSLEGRTVRIPFAATVTRSSRKNSTIHAGIRAWPRGVEIGLDGDLDLSTMDLACSLDIPGLDPQRFADLLPPSFPAVQGTLSVDGRLQVDLKEPEKGVASFELRSETLRVCGGGGPDIVLKPDPAESGPLTLRVMGRALQWDAALSRILIRAGQHRAGLGPVRMGVTLQDQGGVMQGSGEIRYFGSRAPVQISAEEPPGLPMEFSARWGNGAWSVRGKGESDLTSWRLEIPGATFACKRPVVEIDARGEGGRIEASGTVQIPGPDCVIPRGRIRMRELRCVGTVRSEAGTDGAKLTLELSGSRVKANFEGMTVTAPGIRLHGKGRPGGEAATFASTLEVSGAKIVHSASKAAASGISARIPLVWPAKRAGKGTFRIASLAQGTLNFGSVRGAVRQTGPGFAVNGNYRSTPLPGAEVGFSGEIRAVDGGMAGDGAFSLKGYRLPDSFDPSSMVPALAGFRLAGILDVNGAGHLENGQVRARCELGIAEGAVTSGDLDLEVTGIEGTVLFPDLPRLRSGPRQVLAFARARVGEVELVDARAEMQMESPESLFLEQARFSWCGGRVFVQPLRVVPGKDTYDLVLFCDRVRLAPLLQQLGGLRAKGEGAVSGRIPLAINGKSVRFDDGFLYSSPGEGGRVELAGTEIFTAGIPSETMQYAQLDLAREALKEYDYDWVKLGFHSEEDMLLMRLQFDGKPAGPLPFVYDRTFGGFARVKAGHKGSSFQGIRLDVNFRLPLDTILQYGSGAGKIFEMME